MIREGLYLVKSPSSKENTNILFLLVQSSPGRSKKANYLRSDQQIKLKHEVWWLIHEWEWGWRGGGESRQDKSNKTNEQYVYKKEVLCKPVFRNTRTGFWSLKSDALLQQLINWLQWEYNEDLHLLPDLTWWLQTFYVWLQRRRDASDAICCMWRL